MAKQQDVDEKTATMLRNMVEENQKIMRRMEEKHQQELAAREKTIAELEQKEERLELKALRDRSVKRGLAWYRMSRSMRRRSVAAAKRERAREFAKTTEAQWQQKRKTMNETESRRSQTMSEKCDALQAENAAKAHAHQLNIQKVRAAEEQIAIDIRSAAQKKVDKSDEVLERHKQTLEEKKLDSTRKGKVKELDIKQAQLKAEESVETFRSKAEDKVKKTEAQLDQRDEARKKDQVSKNAQRRAKDNSRQQTLRRAEELENTRIEHVLQRRLSAEKTLDEVKLQNEVNRKQKSERMQQKQNQARKKSEAYKAAIAEEQEDLRTRVQQKTDRIESLEECKQELLNLRAQMQHEFMKGRDGTAFQTRVVRRTVSMT